MKVAYQGIPGAYSEIACYQFQKEGYFSKNFEIVPMKDFNSLVKALKAGEIDYGVLPVENSTTGPITRTLDLLFKEPFFALAEGFEEVHHILWGIKEARYSSLQKIYSHPEALMQCQDLFDRHPKIKGEPFLDTASAALFVAEKKDPAIGALASSLAGSIYHLEALDKNVQTEKGNTTRFFLVKKQKMTTKKDIENVLLENPHPRLWTIYFELSHEPGSLATFLNSLQLFHLNLIKLHSRPIKNQPFKYGFFMEVETKKVSSADLLLLIEVLKRSTEYLQLLGSFN